MTTYEINNLTTLNNLNVNLRIQLHETGLVGEGYLDNASVDEALPKTVEAAFANETHVWVDLASTGRPVGRLITEEGRLKLVFFGTGHERREAGLC